MDSKKPTKLFKKREVKLTSIYSRCLITKHITIPITEIGKNIKQTIEHYITNMFEGKCIVEGFIKPGSTKIITYSSGIVKASSVIFEVVFECLSCFPVEGMLIQCVAKNITKAGIRAESVDETPSPVTIFITRDHHYLMPYFSTVSEGDKITARVIGQRFELNDKFVSVIAELVDPKEKERERENKIFKGEKKKLKIVGGGDIDEED